MVSTQLSSLLIHLRLVPIGIGCLFRVTKKLRVIIDDITLPVPVENASCNVSRRRNLTETLFVWRNNLPYMKHLPEDFSVFSVSVLRTRHKNHLNSFSGSLEAVNRPISQKNKIQSQTIDLRTRLWGIRPQTRYYSPEHRTEVYCLRSSFWSI